MDGVFVREARVEDLDALLKLYRELAGEREDARGGEPGISAPVLDEILAQLLSRKERTDAHAFYARLGLEPVAEGLRIYLD